MDTIKKKTHPFFSTISSTLPIRQIIFYLLLGGSALSQDLSAQMKLPKVDSIHTIPSDLPDLKGSVLAISARTVRLLDSLTPASLIPTTLLQSGTQLIHAQQVLPEIPNDFEKRLSGKNTPSYEMFCARRTQTDKEWNTMKETIISFFTQHGYNRAQAYQFHGAISYTAQIFWNSGVIIPVNEAFYTKLSLLLKKYTIPLDQALFAYLGKDTYKNITDPPKPSTRNTKDIPYRTGPTQHTRNFGGKSLSSRHYDRGTAKHILSSHGYRIHSTALQEEEPGKDPMDQNTCLEGLAEQTIQGLIVLMNHIDILMGQNMTARIVINGATEAGHAQGEHIVMGYIRPGFVASVNHAKKHGAGFTVDIRLTGPEALLLKNIFPHKEGRVILVGKDGKRYVYYYSFHGLKGSFHLHLTIFDRETDVFLFGKN